MTKVFLTASMLLLAASAVAHAGTIISDVRYWPSQSTSQQSSASAFDAQARIAGPINDASKSCSYQGGPKTGSRVC